MKRLFLLLIVGAMLFALPSCGEQNNEPDGKTYTDNYVYTMGYPDRLRFTIEEQPKEETTKQ